MACKAKNIYYLAFNRKSLLTSGLEESVLLRFSFNLLTYRFKTISVTQLLKSLWALVSVISYQQ